MKRRLQLLVLLLSVSLWAPACSDRETTFEVDPNHLGPVYADSLLGVSMSPPKDFQAAERPFMADVRRQMRRTPGSDERFFIIPQMIFAVPGTQARCFLSEFPNIGAAVFDEAWKAAYLDEARKKALGQDLQVRDVMLGAIPALEVEIETSESLNLRYVFQGRDGRFLQVDYIVPSENRRDLAHTLGSSIGSLALH